MIALKYEDDLKFKCDTCDQQFSHLTVNLSVLLYGVAILEDHDLSYIGLKCPSCLKTLLIKCDDLYRIIDQLNTIVCPDVEMSSPLLRYNTSVTKYPNNTPQLIEFKKFPCPIQTREDGYLPSFDDELFVFENQMFPSERDRFLSTYSSKVKTSPIGPKEFVLFFLKKDLDALVNIENSQNIRIFPRYVYDTELTQFYRQLNEFCWKFVLGGTQDIYYKPDLVNASFLSLLLDDPDPFSVSTNLEGQFSFYAEIWKLQNPFKDRMAPTDFHEVYNFFEPQDNYVHMIKRIRENQRKTCVCEFLAEYYLLFGKKYIALAQQADFCYGHLWELKLQYLRALYGAIEQQGAKKGISVSVHPHGLSLTTNCGGAVSPLEQYRKVLKTQRHPSRMRKKVRLLAEKLWSEDASITIADMAMNDEINKIAKKKNNQLYSVETLKKWIKDLAPNRSPGIRPKKG